VSGNQNFCICPIGRPADDLKPYDIMISELLLDGMELMD
jgi:hypothetical protein